MTEPLTGIRVLEMANTIQGPAPAPGEGNAEVLGRLGFSKSEIESVIPQATAQREVALAAAR